MSLNQTKIIVLQRTGVNIAAKMALIENFKKIVANYIYLES